MWKPSKASEPSHPIALAAPSHRPVDAALMAMMPRPNDGARHRFFHAVRISSSGSRIKRAAASRQDAFYAARSGARSACLMSGNPSSFRTRLTAPTVALLGAVISMPMGFPLRVKSITNPPRGLGRPLAPISRRAWQVEVCRDRAAMSVRDLQIRVLHLIHAGWTSRHSDELCCHRPAPSLLKVRCRRPGAP